VAAFVAAGAQACGQTRETMPGVVPPDPGLWRDSASAAADGGPDEGLGLDSSQGAADATSEDASGTFVVAPHPTRPQVPNTGKTMNDPTVVTIVASNDSPVDGTDTAANLYAFSDFFGTSEVWSAVTGEYHLGSLSSAAHVMGPPIADGTYTLSQLQSYVSGVLDGGAGVSPNGNTIYVLYLPHGVSFADTTDCGYHSAYPDSMTSTGDELAAVTRCMPYSGETELGQLTRVASHEIVEAATDPLSKGYNLGEPTSQPWTASVWQGWVGAGHAELGDFCEGTRTFEAADGGPSGGWESQRMYSNASAADGGDPCIPPYDEPYYSSSAPQGWYGVQAGSTVEIPLTGWSVAPTSEWLLQAHLVAANPALDGLLDGGVGLMSEAGIGTEGLCDPRFGMNNGVEGVFRVTMPASALSGDYAIFRIDSFREGPSCYPPLSEDAYHLWPVGVFVP
jgi:hypothetical protein